MTVTLAHKHINYEEVDLPGEIYDPGEFSFHLNPGDHPSPSTIKRELILGSDNPHPDFWVLARAKYNCLHQYNTCEAVVLWKLIKDMAYLTEIFNLLKDKPSDQHWVEIYRTSYQRLERIVDTYQTNPRYTNLDQIFDVSGTAQYLSNHLFLEQTRPAGEARIFPDIDEYTGIHDEQEDPAYLNVPHKVSLPDADGDLIEVVLTDHQDDHDAWGGGFHDPDHDWYEEGEIASESLKQWEQGEYQVTREYYQLKRRYKPILKEINRRIDQDPLVHYANPENKTFAIDSAIYSLKNSPLVQALAQSLKSEYREGVPVQDIAALVMELPFELSINGNIDSVIDLFGDHILDTIISPPGITNHPEEDLESDLARFHEQTLAQLEGVANDHSPKLSSAFTTEVFKAVVEDQLPVKCATDRAFDVFRMRSPAGSLAYQQAIQAGHAPALAMRKFYDQAQAAGEYTPRDRFFRADHNRALVLTAASGYTEARELSWGLAKFKAGQGELFVPQNAPQESKRWLFNFLSQKDWGQKLIAKLAE